MGRVLFLVFVAVPLVEIAFFIVIGQTIGLWPTLAGVLAMAIIGAVVLRIQGLSLINEIRASVSRGQLPARALADAMMVAIAGVLLITPGYFTDLMGILLLVPPVRGAIYAFVRSRVQVVATSTGGFAYAQKRVDEGMIELDDDEWRPR